MIYVIMHKFRRHLKVFFQWILCCDSFVLRSTQFPSHFSCVQRLAPVTHTHTHVGSEKKAHGDDQSLSSAIFLLFSKVRIFPHFCCRINDVLTDSHSGHDNTRHLVTVQNTHFVLCHTRHSACFAFAKNKC